MVLLCFDFRRICNLVCYSLKTLKAIWKKKALETPRMKVWKSIEFKVQNKTNRTGMYLLLLFYQTGVKQSRTARHRTRQSVSPRLIWAAGLDIDPVSVVRGWSPADQIKSNWRVMLLANIEAASLLWGSNDACPPCCSFTFSLLLFPLFLCWSNKFCMQSNENSLFQQHYLTLSAGQVNTNGQIYQRG